MEIPYSPSEIEKEIQERWQKDHSFQVIEDSSKEKFYCLSMLPYPSGALHMGHVRNYAIGDVITRYQRMLGKNVLQPIGWDAFGLPAENAAIKHKVPPAKWTYQNIAHMKNQLKRLGFAYDWNREVTTCDPDYYRWEQWFFIQLYKKGLVYKKNAIVNWDPVDQTVLANEQVVDGRGWRSGALVERRELPQWFLKITAYADELLNDLDKLTGWPEQVRAMQRNWIGRSEGALIHFLVPSEKSEIIVFSTRPDTLMGATYLAIAPEHPLAQKAAENQVKIKEFIEACRHIKVAEADIATMEKLGVDTGFTATHPITKKPVPIWIANFVLMEYGTGAVMAVPAHDQRDWEFAKKYQLPIQQVIDPPSHAKYDLNRAAFTDNNGTLINSDQFNGLNFTEACQAITKYLEKHQLGKTSVHYRLRDWGVSRQRYWGTPIPMIHCTTCGTLPVPEKDLPVKLPEHVEITGSGESPLKANKEFYEVTCPQCQKKARRETDTFDTFIESSWYYARYTCPDQHNAMLDDRVKYWTPVDQYIGGIEHAVMHLLYARFFHKLMRDLGLVNSDEPFTRLLTQGMVLKDGHKMSKSKGNTVDPQALIDRYGADTVRLFALFAAPPEQSLEWADSGVEGCYRFLRRLWNYAHDAVDIIQKINADHSVLSSADWEKINDEQSAIRYEIYQNLRQAEYDYDRMQFNTVISSAMKIFNATSKIALTSENSFDHHLIQEGMSILLRILAPVTPHISQYLWEKLGFGADVLKASWPKIPEKALQLKTLEYVVQINGKLRGHLQMASEIKADEVETLVRADETLQRFLENKEIKKAIVISHRQLINLVVIDK